MPKLKEGQVLVDIAYSGLCRTQINEIHGSKGKDRYLPHTLGHEGAGVVREVGPRVEKVNVGDHVVLTWIKGGGADVSSVSYERRDGTKVNSGAISTLMTLTVASENRLVKIPGTMPLREASLLGCAIPTGAGIIRNTVKMVPGSSIAIFGVGGIGLSALLMAKAGQARTMIAVDVYGSKLDQARALGATHTIHVGQQDVLSTICSLTNERGVDYAVESAGTRQSMETAFQCVRDQGGLCVLAGNLPAGQQISIDPFDLIKGKRIVGTWGGETQPDAEIPAYVEAYLSGNFDIGALITHEYSLQEVNQAFEALEQGKAGRVLVKMTTECN